MGESPEAVTVLHLDDDPAVGELTATYLEGEAERFTVETVTDVSDALAYLDGNEVDCIVSDYEMPEMDGIEFLRSVRADFPELPFILFTGKGSEEVASEAISAGVTDYLQKGGDAARFEILSNRIENAVERNRTRQALAEREEQYRAIAHNSHDAIFIRRGEEFAYVNDRACQLTGYDREAFHELDDIWELVHPADRERLIEYAAGRASGDDAPRTYEARIVTSDGAIKHGEFGIERITYGGESAVLGTVRDITDYQRKQRELEEERQFIDTALDTLDDIFYVVSPEGEFLRWNDKLPAVTGYTDAEIRDRDAASFFEDDDVDRIQGFFEDIIETGQASIEADLVTKDGTRIPYASRARRLTDIDDELVGIVGISRDISERRGRVRTLESRNQDLEDLHRTADALYSAETVEECYELTIDTAVDILGFDWCTLAAPADDQVYFEIKAVSEEAPVDVGDNPFRLDEGLAGEVYQTKEPSIVSDVFENDHSKPTHESIRAAMTVPVADWGIFQAVTSGADDGFDDDDRRHAELLVTSMITAIERIDQEARLRRQRDQLEEFASIVSHDLRNPLTVAQGRLELAMDATDNENLEAVARAHDRIERLIDDLLGLAREGEQVGDVEPIPLDTIVEHCWTNVVKDDAVLEVGTDSVLRADRTRFSQLLENLLRNAVEHGGEDVTITIGEFSDGFYFEDDGPGIPEDQRDRVFEAGFSTEADGTGLGLEVVTNVVEAHGWSIRVTEAPSGGARFEITGIEFVD